MIHFIVNPAAGYGRAVRAAEELERELTRREVAHVFQTAAGPMDAKRLAEAAARQKPDAIVCVGGDGTVQETVGGMLYSGVPLGVIPAGSGNDFVSTFAFRQSDSALERVLRGRRRTIDLIRCTAGGGEAFYCANIGSTGLDADIVFCAGGLKKRLKKFAYLAATVRTIFSFQPARVTVEADGTPLGGEITLAAACNGQRYGGGFQIAPAALPDDGWITLELVGKMPGLKLMTLFPLALIGKHEILRDVSVHRVKSVTLRYEGRRRVNLDGNLYDWPGPVRFEILPGALDLIV